MRRSAFRKVIFESFRQQLYSADPELNAVRLNIAVDDDGKSFWVLRMKVRKQIVADGIDDPTFNPAHVGRYLKADEVNDMIAKPDTIFVDMRNHYEYEVGHFEKCPGSSLRHLPRPIAYGA